MATDYVRLPKFLHELPSGEILENDGYICESPYCTCPVLSAHWTGEFDPGKVTACSPKDGDPDEWAETGGYDYTFGYKTKWDLSGVIRDCDIRPSRPFENWDVYHPDFDYVPYLYEEIPWFVCSINLTGTISYFNTPSGTITENKTFSLSMAATPSGWIPLEMPLYFNSKMEQIYDEDEWEFIKKLISRPCFAFIPGGSAWGTYPDDGPTDEHRMYGCGFNSQDVVHCSQRINVRNTYNGRTDSYRLSLCSTNRNNHYSGVWPDFDHGSYCEKGLDKWDEETDEGIIWHIEGYCLDFEINKRDNESSMYTIDLTKNTEIPLQYDEVTSGLINRPIGTKEISWIVNGNSFSSTYWGDVDDDEEEEIPYAALGGTIEIPPSGFNKLEIGYIEKEEGE